MIFARLGPVVLLGIALPSAAEAQARHYAPDEVVQFVNNSSAPVTVSVDGAQVCVISPGNRCSATLAGAHDNSKHRIHAISGGRTFDDQVAISECHWNWNGLKTYTFTNGKVPFNCQR